MVAPMLGAVASRYQFDPSVGAYYDTLTGQYVMAVNTAPMSAGDGSTTFDVADQPPTEAFATGESTMVAPPATIQAAPITPSSQEHPGTPGPNYLVPPDYQLADLKEISSLGGPSWAAPGLVTPGDATTQQMPVPPSLYPGSGAAPPTASGGVATGGGTTSGGGSSSGGSYGSSYGSGGGFDSYRRGSGSRYSSGGGSSFGDSYDGLDNVPAYANGTVHPAVSGEPLTPGGFWNDGSSSSRFRYGGSSPAYDAHKSHARRVSPNFANTLGIGYEDRPPGLARQMRWNIMDRVNQTAMGAMGGAMGGPQGMPTSTTAGTPGVGGGMGPTGLRGMRGWARQQGFTPASLQDIYYNPQWLYPHINRGLAPGTTLFNQVDDLLSPNLQSLWMGSAGARKVRNPNGLGPDQYANWINRTVGNYMRPGGQVFNANRLIQGLTLPKRGSTQWMANQGATFGEQAYNLQNQIGSVAAVTMNPMAASATMAYLDTLLNRAGSRNLTRGPKRQINPGNVVARNLFR